MSEKKQETVITSVPENLGQTPKNSLPEAAQETNILETLETLLEPLPEPSGQEETRFTILLDACREGYRFLNKSNNDSKENLDLLFRVARNPSPYITELAKDKDFRGMLASNGNNLADGIKTILNFGDKFAKAGTSKNQSKNQSDKDIETIVELARALNLAEVAKDVLKDDEIIDPTKNMAISIGKTLSIMSDKMLRMQRADAARNFRTRENKNIKTFSEYLKSEEVTQKRKELINKIKETAVNSGKLGKEGQFKEDIIDLLDPFLENPKLLDEIGLLLQNNSYIGAINKVIDIAKENENFNKAISSNKEAITGKTGSNLDNALGNLKGYSGATALVSTIAWDNSLNIVWNIPGAIWSLMPSLKKEKISEEDVKKLKGATEIFLKDPNNRNLKITETLVEILRDPQKNIGKLLEDPNNIRKALLEKDNIFKMIEYTKDEIKKEKFPSKDNLKFKEYLEFILNKKDTISNIIDIVKPQENGYPDTNLISGIINMTTSFELNTLKNISKMLVTEKPNPAYKFSTSQGDTGVYRLFVNEINSHIMIKTPDGDIIANDAFNIEGTKELKEKLDKNFYDTKSRNKLNAIVKGILTDENVDNEKLSMLVESRKNRKALLQTDDLYRNLINNKNVIYNAVKLFSDNYEKIMKSTKEGKPSNTEEKPDIVSSLLSTFKKNTSLDKFSFTEDKNKQATNIKNLAVNLDDYIESIPKGFDIKKLGNVISSLGSLINENEGLKGSFKSEGENIAQMLNQFVDKEENTREALGKIGITPDFANVLKPFLKDPEETIKLGDALKSGNTGKIVGYFVTLAISKPIDFGSVMMYNAKPLAIFVGSIVKEVANPYLNTVSEFLNKVAKKEAPAVSENKDVNISTPYTKPQGLSAALREEATTLLEPLKIGDGLPSPTPTSKASTSSKEIKR